MVKTDIKAKSVLMLLIATAFIMAAAFGGSAVYANSSALPAGGTYTVPVDLSGLPMGRDNFSSNSTVEKMGDTYYMSFGHSSSISNLLFEIGGRRVGCTAEQKDGWTIYTYTLSEASIKSSMSFSARVNVMDREVDFSIKLKLSEAAKTSDTIADLGERPAEFVPVITTSAGGHYQAAQGSVFTIPNAAAKLGTEEIPVTLSAYYVRADIKEDITVENNRFKLENIGEYYFSYTASSPLHTTSAENDTNTVLSFKVLSQAGAIDLAKFHDKHGVMPEGASLQASQLTSGTLHEAAKEKIKKLPIILRHLISVL